MRSTVPQPRCKGRGKNKLEKILILKGNKKKAVEYIKQFMEYKAQAEMYKEK